jgi:uncharacterized tellurite resistance protein B-like protein
MLRRRRFAVQTQKNQVVTYMFDSIKHWFESLEQRGRMFEHPENEALHVALASVFFHAVDAGEHPDARKKREFGRLLKQELGVDDDEVERLYRVARDATGSLRDDLHTVNHYLNQNQMVRLEFMRKLMQLIDVEGVEPQEMEIFFEALHEFFPEVKQLRDEDL